MRSAQQPAAKMASCGLQHALPDHRRFSHLPQILIFMTPQIKDPAILRLCFEKLSDWIADGLRDSSFWTAKSH